MLKSQIFKRTNEWPQSSRGSLNRLNNLHITLNRDFADYLENKSVAILGRGPSLQSCSRSVIESYDVIVRVHRPAPIEDWWPPPLVQEEWQSMVGSRTNILYSSLGRGANDAFIERVTSSFKDEGGKFLCHPHPWYAITNQYSCSIMERTMPVRYVDIALYHSLYKYLRVDPFPGTLVVADILTHKVSKVFIGGMTCYCDRSKVGIMEDYKKSKCDFNYIRSIWQCSNDQIVVDPVMEELFNIIGESVPETAPGAHDLYQVGDNGVVNRYIE